MVLLFICTNGKNSVYVLLITSCSCLLTWKYALVWISFNKINANFEKLMFQNLKHLH